MKEFINVSFALLFIVSLPLVVQAQTPDDSFRDQFNRHFDYASMRIQSLAEAMPEEHFSWAPGEDVMSFAEVCMHIAHYNYLYPVETLGYPAPEGIDLDQMESISDKETIVEELRRSIEYVKKTMEDISDEEFNKPAQLYGQDVTVQAVFMQLITHKSEHVGQAIAYSRTNGVVPPWSR